MISTPPSRVADLVRYFLQLGTLGFGGPIALVGYMQRDLVEQRGWFTREEYMEGLALAQLMPGPLAAQLAIYLGWVRAGVMGATLAGIAFILPSFLIVLVLSACYLRFGGLPWMQGLFYGIGAAVIAIIARSAAKLVRMTLERDLLLWAVFALNALVTAWKQQELVSVFLLSGLVVMLARGRPPGAPLHSVSLDLLLALAAFFAKAGALVFGSGLAIVPFLHAAVTEHHWLTERQFLDAVAVAMITPGPVVITVAFIGYLVAGLPGATVSAAAVFLPVYLFVVLPARYFRGWVKHQEVRAFVAGVTAAATGAIAGAAIVLARRAIVDAATIAICLGTMLALWKLRRVPEPVVMLAAGAVGWIYFR